MKAEDPEHPQERSRAERDRVAAHQRAADRRIQGRAVATILCIAAALTLVAVRRHFVADEDVRIGQARADAWARYETERNRFTLSNLASEFLAGQGAEKESEQYALDARQREMRAQQLAGVAREDDEAKMNYRRALKIRFGQAALELALLLAALTLWTSRPSGTRPSLCRQRILRAGVWAAVALAVFILWP